MVKLIMSPKFEPATILDFFLILAVTDNCIVAANRLAHIVRFDTFSLKNRKIIHFLQYKQQPFWILSKFLIFYANTYFLAISKISPWNLGLLEGCRPEIIEEFDKNWDSYVDFSFFYIFPHLKEKSFFLSLKKIISWANYLVL